MSGTSEGEQVTSDSDVKRQTPEADFPTAAARDSKSTLSGRWKRMGTRLWLLTAVCAVTAIWLTSTSLLQRPTEISVRFHEGHGLQPGNALRYRGIAVGEVTGVQLSDDLQYLEVSIALERKAEGVAREGSQFWIRRPQISLARIRGLDTVVGGHYVEVSPGPVEGQRVLDFQGLETPPTLAVPKPTQIRIRFPDGHGLAVGDVLRHRGIEVGEVRDVRLQDDLSGVEVVVQLVESASPVAKAGSQFWIVRPEVTTSGIRGLDTVVTGRHIAVVPGAAEAAAQTEFLGLATAPAVMERSEGGLEVILESEDRHGLTAGAPVVYRGIQIGQVASIGLTSDARNVEARARIRPEFRRLVRSNSRFWTISGVGLRLGWTGIQMDMESLSTLAAGGVELGTPDPPGGFVSTGHKFTLRKNAEDQSPNWQPSISIGNSLLPDNVTLPAPIRVSLRWQPRTLGIPRRRQRNAWVLPLEKGRVLGPADILAPSDQVRKNEPVLSLVGKTTEPSASRVQRFGPLAIYTPKGSLGAAILFSSARLRVPSEPENCVLIADPLARPVPLAASRLQVNRKTWQVDAAIPLDESWHGASVVSRANGDLIGLLCVPDNKPIIVPLSDALVAAL